MKPTSIFQCLGEFASSTPAKIALFGRRGAGKTTLLSVLIEMKAGEMSAVYPAKCDNCWKVLQDSHGKSIEVLDTSGFQSVYRSEDQNNIEEELIHIALEEKTPDVILFVIKAKEVNSAVKGDINALAKIVSSIKDRHLAVPPIIVVVSQCDELDLSNIKTEEDKLNYPDEWENKLENINSAVEMIRMNINNYSDISYYVYRIIPIAAYFRIRRDGSIDKDPRMSFRWNVDHLIETITESIGNWVSKD